MSEIPRTKNRTAIEFDALFEPLLIPMMPLNYSKSIQKPCSAWRGKGKFPVFKSASFGAFEDQINAWIETIIAHG